MLDVKNMTKSDFWYDLPKELIAQHPIEPRNASRMMKIDRKTGECVHSHFYDLCDFLQEGDLLVLNDSRVLPARIYGKRADTGSFIEFLLLEQRGNEEWEILCRPGKKAKVGAKFVFGEGKLTAEITDVLEDGNRVAKFTVLEGNIYSVLDEIGQMPLPPYITEKLEDKERYQTVYSHEIGSSAAPTAGLHFTKEMLADIQKRGINIAYVTLHVGLGTFRPVKEDRVLDHKMHSEHYEIPEETAKMINETKACGGRVIAVGTTSCRTLEAAAQKYGKIISCEGRTEIFIYPGFEFKVLDGLITNFHLPESTLIMLVSAFLGYENTMNAYKIAVEEKYRFFSFGDCMFIS
ncbi:tRNA preQ1(34) S-adenosylmethionine ribosyltransferase-isomerase QueA [Ruminococcus sp. 210702-SL.1.03]|uniref:tRNA preQ1(34) S-adenosylmethionine ribosyltransferase-isomerase QueA n=1 Tax=Ruminococcus sp. 210702-SL.1.03 TaxID=2883233 RepID=UPI0029C9DE56|nr:tRNA preQ1(34) S-adenosylmethionine ribosyltransferase-isomerase QueA [Ruminococcus sp. 210702-SL.1.03]